MKLDCECGKLIVDQTDFLSFKGYVISDQDYSSYLEAIDEAIEKSGPSKNEKEKACMAVRCLAIKYFKTTYQCPDCGRVYISGSDGTFHQYAPNNSFTSKKILQSEKKA